MATNTHSETDEPTETAPDASARALALDAVIRTAIDRADRSTYRQRFHISDVLGNLQGDVGDRTVRRALGDAAELGWLRDRSRGTKSYRPGPLATGYQPRPDDDSDGGE